MVKLKFATRNMRKGARKDDKHGKIKGCEAIKTGKKREQACDEIKVKFDDLKVKLSK